MPSIIGIKKRVSKLSKEKRELFDRFFFLDVPVGRLKLPKQMHEWVKKQFGSLSAVTRQHIVRVENKFTNEAALFNEIRALRPMMKIKSNVQEQVESARGGPFSKPEVSTPADTFGRVKGKHGITGSNVAKYDKWHGLIIFDEHDPLKFTKSSVIDHMEIAKKWFTKAHKEDKEANYPYIIWQCLWKSGATIIHGHIQLMLPRRKHYSGFERLNKIRQEYLSDYGTNYFEELYDIHEALGLGIKKGSVKVLVHLTPKKEKEIMIIAPSLSKQFSQTLYECLACLRDDLGVESFTLGIALPPMVEQRGWKGFPIIARVIDRGSLSNHGVDIGAMEFIAEESVVSSDPYSVMKKLKKRL